jgi:hypothetical protein
MLRQSIERYASKHYDFAQRWAALESPLGYSEQAWSDYARFGWLALRLTAEQGGIDAGPHAIEPLMEAVGARLLLEPILASVIIGTGLMLRRASAEQQSERLSKLADGSLKLAFAHQETLNAFSQESVACSWRAGALSGVKLAVLHGNCADQLIVSARNRDRGDTLSLYLVDADALEVRRQSFRLLDGRGAANIYLDSARAEPLGAEGGADADAVAIAAVLDEAAVALCAEGMGAIHALNSATNQFLKTRQQFGRALGANQALQHRMVEMYVLEQEARALTLAAVRALADSYAERARLISGARAFVCGAASKIAAEAVQMHGGMGVSDELDISHYYRRVMVMRTLFGNRDFHFARFAESCVSGAAS